MIRRYASAFGISLALHVAFGIGAVWLAARVSYSPAARPRGPSRPTVVVVRASELPDAGRGRPADPRGDAAADDLVIVVDDDASSLTLAGFTIDFGKIANRAPTLFPFLTGTPALQQITIAPPSDASPRLTNPFARPGRMDVAAPPLILAEGELQGLVDRSWSRRERWRGFEGIAALAAAHSPNDGSLPGLLRAYVTQNGLQPYADMNARDPRLWVQLGLAADHVDFIEFISQYAARHPSSKGTTELLFLLDKMAQGSLDALTTLLDVDPSRHLRWTREANRDAYNGLVSIQEHYRTTLDRRDIATRDSLRLYYDGVRVSILQHILRATPQRYRANDARYLIGAIYWKQGKVDAAVQVWSGIAADAGDTYLRAYSAILEALDARIGRRPDGREINRILDEEHDRWVAFSLGRLRQFGYRLDTY